RRPARPTTPRSRPMGGAHRRQGRAASIAGRTSSWTGAAVADRRDARRMRRSTEQERWTSMSALPAGPDPIADQDHTHGWIRALLEAVTSAVLETQPGPLAFGDHRPERERTSGRAWRRLETEDHGAAPLATAPDPE